MSGTLVPAAAFAFICGLLGAWLMARAGMMDMPEDRSLHGRPTPRGGGIGVIAAAGAGFAWAGFQPVPLGGAAAILAATTAIGALGLVDDLRPVNARVKFAVMGLVGLALTAALGPPDLFDLAGTALGLPWMTGLLGGALFVLVTVNAVNFMDGSDGMLAAVMIPAGVGLAVAGLVTGVIAAGVAGTVLAASLAGFLLLNHPPARVFAGDCGSLGAGALYAAGALAMAGQGFSGSLWLAPLFVLPFLADVLLTLLRRARAGRFSFNPHREHAYQRLIAAGWNHGRVALAYAGLTALCVLAGLLAAQGPDWAPFAAFWATVAVLTGLYGAAGRFDGR